MKIAQIDNNRIHKIYPPEEAAWYPPEVQKALNFQDVPDDAQEGWVWDDATEAWVEPVPPAPPVPEPDRMDILGLAILDLYEQQQQNQERVELALMDLYEAVSEPREV